MNNNYLDPSFWDVSPEDQSSAPDPLENYINTRSQNNFNLQEKPGSIINESVISFFDSPIQDSMIEKQTFEEPSSFEETSSLEQKIKTIVSQKQGSLNKKKSLKIESLTPIQDEDDKESFENLLSNLGPVQTGDWEYDLDSSSDKTIIVLAFGEQGVVEAVLYRDFCIELVLIDKDQDIVKSSFHFLHDEEECIEEFKKFISCNYCLLFEQKCECKKNKAKEHDDLSNNTKAKTSEMDIDDSPEENDDDDLENDEEELEESLSKNKTTSSKKIYYEDDIEEDEYYNDEEESEKERELLIQKEKEKILKIKKDLEKKKKEEQSNDRLAKGTSRDQKNPKHKSLRNRIGSGLFNKK